MIDDTGDTPYAFLQVYPSRPLWFSLCLLPIGLVAPACAFTATNIDNVG
jgi:hypothetical protein